MVAALSRPSPAASSRPLPPPAFCERGHRGFAARLIAVRRPAIFVVAKGQRPHPRRSDWRGVHLHPILGPDFHRLDRTSFWLAHSFDHLIGAQQERVWDRQPDRFGGCQIDDQIEFGRLLDRDIAGLRPAQNLVGQLGVAPE
jgi:hypothetical protein